MSYQTQRIPVEPFRDAALEVVESGRMTWSDICKAMGWISRKGFADTTRLKRVLGITAQSRPEGAPFNRSIKYDTACRVVRGIGADPVDFDV